MIWINMQEEQPQAGCEVLAITKGGRPTPVYRSLENEWRIPFSRKYLLWSDVYNTPPMFWMEMPEKPMM